MSSQIEFILNNTTIKTDLSSSTILLDFIRDSKLKGTKIGCREGDCGACTVIAGELRENKVDYHAIPSCLTPLGNIQGKHVVTVEGLSIDAPTLVQLELVNSTGTQCGFCSPGFIMSMTASCLNNTNPEETIDGNICRCTGYYPIISAAKRVFTKLKKINKEKIVDELIALNIIPGYFKEIPNRLQMLHNSTSSPESKKIVGGGTDLYVQNPHQMKNLELNHFSLQSDLRFISKSENIIIIGAGTTMSDLIESPIITNIIPLKQLKLIASSPIRNLATLGGNIINASPIADFAIILLALDAELKLNCETTRTLKLEQFYIGYKDLNKRENEYISEFNIPTINNLQFNFEKVSKRTYLDIASVNSGCAILLKNNIIKHIRISAGGVFAYPLYLKETSEFLSGKPITVEIVKGAIKIAMKEIAPISDVRGSKEYKTILLRQLLIAHFMRFNEGLSVKEVIE